ncbi:HesA/MoeB/ThiF family protein [Desmospora profundinema]|uniref:Molybdopterin/thiamine biosynthesis adenylyltransferase n=1 Tax=Desmospora profundinema TaxID=1571184 RepID=A0ABU1IMI3_9BACL|nr:HesA/MoeB/ThiF family protein [Desmospora profundinema]MDR6225988.1 molybdopterin/thiamine biosynthesis adenylyltransferase [Desmospora profundinema]
MIPLTEIDKQQFGWQMMIPDFGESAQKKLKGASALVTRVGGLGSPTALYLAMAGIGKLVIAHGGVPELGHMNRWILSPYEAVGKTSPVESVSRFIKQLTPSIEIVTIKENVNEENVENMVAEVDIAFDCPPYFEERKALNRECVRQNKPMVEASVCYADGYLTSIKPGETPCLECLGFQSEEWKLPFPIIGAVSGTMGALAAMEGVKIITGVGQPLYNQLMVYNGETTTFQNIKVIRNPDCSVCGELDKGVMGL